MSNTLRNELQKGMVLVMSMWDDLIITLIWHGWIARGRGRSLTRRVRRWVCGWQWSAEDGRERAGEYRGGFSNIKFGELNSAFGESNACKRRVKKRRINQCSIIISSNRRLVQIPTHPSHYRQK